MNLHLSTELPLMPKRSPTQSATEERAVDSLIDWHEPDRNSHVLDWRRRAHEFGLVPLDSHQHVEQVVEPAEQLLEEDVPEAFDEQRFDGGEPEAAESAEAEEERLSQDDVDLVRVYLRHIGRRKLLKAQEEQAIGRTIEVA